MFREGRHVQKSARKTGKKTTETTSIFQSKIDEKSMNKWVAAPFLAKIEKITVLGSQFSPKNDFLVDSGVPWGTQKSPPRGGPHWQWTLLDPTWDHFGAQIDRYLIFLSFGVPLGSIWGPSGRHFKKNCNEFSIVFLV